MFDVNILPVDKLYLAGAKLVKLLTFQEIICEIFITIGDFINNSSEIGNNDIILTKLPRIF